MSSASHGSKGEGSARPPERVVVAEDSPPNRSVLALILRKMGFDPIECADGAAAWAAIEQGLAAGAETRAVISDLMMPEMDGLELLRRVRGEPRLEGLPFVLVTAVSDKDYIFEAKSLQVNGYVLKPVTYARVESKLREIFPLREFPKAGA